MKIEVLKPGAMTSVQDGGRHGYLHTGLSPAGPMDSLSLRIASLIVGNEIPPPLFTQGPRGDAGLEITLMGPTLKFNGESVLAITGAEFPVTLDGLAIPSYEAIHVLPGQILDFGVAKTGLRGYLAVAGGIDVEPVLGSRSDNLFASRGPFGRALRQGDSLPIKQLSSIESRPIGTKFNVAKLDNTLDKDNLRVVMGPQDELFTEESIRDFLSSVWKLGMQANRMGMRFKGPKLKFRERPEYLIRDAGPDPSNIVDDMIPVGGIQCPSGIEAIVMGPENPTVGGFAKIATVISTDIGIAGQMKPGAETKFEAVSVEEALAIASNVDSLISAANLE